MRLLSLVALSACTFEPQLGDGEIACGAGGRCPPGYGCALDGRCHLPPLDRFDLALRGDPADLTTPDLTTPDLATPDLAPRADLSQPICGAPGQPCCAGDSCGAAACCAASLCLASGANADSGLICLDTVIASCGSPGLPCCENNGCGTNGCCSGNLCSAAGTPCAAGGSCMLGSCGSCGGAGKACCHGDANGGATSDYCTQADTACDPATSTCKACGAPGQLCCDGNRCDAGGCCNHSLSLAGGCLADGSFAGDGKLCLGGYGGGGSCGGPGQAVCDKKVGCTTAETRNLNDSCVSCGVAGQPCCTGVRHGWCAPPFACNLDTALCADCGGDGQPCCAGGQCPLSTMRACNMGFCH